MADQPTCVLHLGLPRTGTKTLQFHLFARHPAIYYLGIFDGQATPDKWAHGNTRDAAVREILSEIAWNDVTRPNFVRCRQLFRETIAPQLARGEVPVLSWEGFSTADVARRCLMARNLRKVFGPCRVALTLRHPVDLLESFYYLTVRRENRPGRPLWFKPIDVWLAEEYRREITPHLDYAKTLDIYREQFGDSAVRPFLFEHLREDPAAYVESWCRFIGIDPEQGARLAAGRAENRSSAAMIARVRRISQSNWRQWFFRRLSSGMRFDYLMLPSIGGRPALPRIAQQGRRRIAESTRDANRRLVECYGLPLERFGYPL